MTWIFKPGKKLSGGKLGKLLLPIKKPILSRRMGFDVKELRQPGNPFSGPMALRPTLPDGLPLSALKRTGFSTAFYIIFKKV